MTAETTPVKSASRPNPRRLWLILAGVVISALIFFPPQQRVGNWLTDDNRTPPSIETNRFDRYEFGHFPSFRWVGALGTTEPAKIPLKLTLGETGPYSYTHFRWVVDREWLTVLVIFAGVGIAIIAAVEWQLEESAARRPAVALSTSEQMRRRLRWAIIAMVVIAAAAFVRSHIELRSDRERIAAHCRDWSDRLKRDPNDTDALNRLVKVLNGKWSFAATYAAVSLGDAGPNALPAIHDLIRKMNANQIFVSREALRAIGKVSKGSDIGVDPLIQKLESEERWISPSFAADGLGEVGAPAERALPTLRRLAEESADSILRHSAARAIEEIEADIEKAKAKQG